MERVTQKFLKSLAKGGHAIDITDHSERLINYYTVVAVSVGVYGVNGKLIIDRNNQLYVICSRSVAVFTY